MKNTKNIILIISMIAIIIGLTIIFIKKDAIQATKNNQNQVQTGISQNNQIGTINDTNSNNETNHENDVTVKMIYNTLKYDIEIYDYIKEEINLTEEQQNKIINFYKSTDLSNLPPDKQVDLEIIGIITLEFSDGNSIAVDNNGDEYASLNHKKIIKISKEFKQYILNIIND